MTELVRVDRASQLLHENGKPDSEIQIRSFIQTVPDLLDWLEQHGREFPWRYTTDPWRVYVSEILLQRTRGGAVAAIYDEFFNRFPDPETLYRADEEEIHDVVSSLGFGNQRTRTLQDVAELCHCEYGGDVPQDLEVLKQPWRVGPYSARACLQFAFNEPHALVDANVARVIERVLDYEMPTQPHKSDTVYELMECLVPDDPEIARAFNLALLDLGALICTPDKPQCPACPLEDCCAFAATKHR
jgi:A/G-specific adenine glycosylase